MELIITNPQCPTCKEYNTWWTNDEAHIDEDMSLEEED